MNSSDLPTLWWVIESAQTSLTAPLFSGRLPKARLPASAPQYGNSGTASKTHHLPSFSEYRAESILQSSPLSLIRIGPQVWLVVADTVSWVSVSLLICLYSGYGTHYLSPTAFHFLASLSPCLASWPSTLPLYNPLWSSDAQVRLSSQSAGPFSGWFTSSLWGSPHSPGPTGRDSTPHVASFCTPLCHRTGWGPLNAHPLFSFIVSPWRVETVSALSAAISAGT